jgi:hypothetical protein
MAGSQKATSHLFAAGRHTTWPADHFNAALIKDGISRIVNGLEEESHAKAQGRQEHQ